MPWEIFERSAGRYADWYATARGQRVDRSERALLAWLLARFPDACRVLEIGCGSAHFTAGLAPPGGMAIGLERSPAMLRAARRRAAGSPLVLGDAHRLPFRDAAVDVAVLITTLEFLDLPVLALQESARVAGRGLALLVLNRWSLGAVSRRWGPASAGSLRGRARDLALPRVRRQVERAAAGRLLRLHWRATLLPRPLDQLVVPLPFGDVIGVAVELALPGAPGPQPPAG